MTGTFVEATVIWDDTGLDLFGAHFPVPGEFGSNGQASLIVSSLALNGGRSWVEVWTTPTREVCESQFAWKLDPGHTPFDVFFDSLAAPVLGEDGEMGIESVGELGDVFHPPGGARRSG
jgi:hypothetical protein